MADSKSEKRDLRLEMRVKNNLLWRGIHDVYPTVAAFCRAHNLNQITVGKLISFKNSPFTKKGEYRPVVLRVSEALGVAPTELFPPKLYANMLKVGSLKTIEVSSFAALPRAVQKEILCLPAPVEQGPDALCAKTELDEKRKKAIEAVLKTLSYREREIIKLRYGFSADHNTYTLEEVGYIFKVNRERIRQIEANAIRKLQMPYRSEKLANFLD